MTFGTEKLEWFGYPIVKKTENIFTRFDRIHERDVELSLSLSCHWIFS